MRQREETRRMGLARCGAALAIALLVLPGRAGAVEFVREEIRIPMPAAGPRGLEGLLVHTDEPGRHPLVLINHGLPRDAAERPKMSPFQFYPPAIEFVRRGWTAAVVMRRNFGDSGGAFAEGLGTCNNPDYVRPPSAAATDIKAAIASLVKRPDIDASRILSVGHSAGGLATVALTAAPPPGLVAAISFAGGNGSPRPDTVCQPDREVAAFGEFGKQSRIPMLWVYAENDHFFGPALAQRFRAAFTAAGGRLVFVKAAPYGEDGHNLFSSAGGIPQWTPVVDNFLKTQNLVLRAKPLPPPTPPHIPPPPQLAANGRDVFAQFLAEPPHKAFAVSPTGAFGWASGRRSVDAAKAAALGFCPQTVKDCRVVVIDDAAVR